MVPLGKFIVERLGVGEVPLQGEAVVQFDPLELQQLLVLVVWQQLLVLVVWQQLLVLVVWQQLLLAGVGIHELL